MAQLDKRSMLQWSQLSMSIPNKPIFLSSLSEQIAPKKQHWTTCQTSSHGVLHKPENNTSAFQSSSLGKVQLPIFPIWLRKDWLHLGVMRKHQQVELLPWESEGARKADGLTNSYCPYGKKIRAKCIARNSLRCTARRKLVIFFLKGQNEVPHLGKGSP